jgi:hypothetical protein
MDRRSRRAEQDTPCCPAQETARCRTRGGSDPTTSPADEDDEHEVRDALLDAALTTTDAKKAAHLEYDALLRAEVQRQAVGLVSGGM